MQVLGPAQFQLIDKQLYVENQVTVSIPGISDILRTRKCHLKPFLYTTPTIHQHGYTVDGLKKPSQ